MRQQATTLLTGILIGLLVAGLLLLLLSQPRKYGVELQPPPTPEPLMIHVAGAVQNPGVYELPLHAIIADAIKAADLLDVSGIGPAKLEKISELVSFD